MGGLGLGLAGAGVAARQQDADVGGEWKDHVVVESVRDKKARPGTGHTVAHGAAPAEVKRWAGAAAVQKRTGGSCVWGALFQAWA